MLRSRECEDGNRTQLSHHPEANASRDYRPRREPPIFSEQWIPESVAAADKTIGEIARPDLCRRRSPIDADLDWQFDLKRETARTIPKAPDAIQHAQSEPDVLAQKE